MPTPVDGDVEQRGDLELSCSAFDDGERMNDEYGYANENRNPVLRMLGVPDGAESLVLVMDDPDAEPVVGHVWDHWLMWDIDPVTVDHIPRNYGPAAAQGTVGYNDYGEQDYGGPAPPGDEEHTYRFKLLALDAELGLPPEARKAVVGHTIAQQADVLASTQLTGTYHGEQGTIF